MPKKAARNLSDPTDPIRLRATRYPEVDEGYGVYAKLLQNR